MTGMNINLPQLRQGSRQFDNLATEFQQKNADFQNQLQNLGQPWGGDIWGQPFGELYMPVAQAYGQAMQHLADLFGVIAQNADKMAADPQNADQALTWDISPPTGTG
jgi:uncharacterized protein YukE